LTLLFVFDLKEYQRRKHHVEERRFSAALSLLPIDLRYVTHYDGQVIRSIRHKGLKRLYEDDDPRGVIREHTAKLRDILARLDAAGSAADLDLPGFRLHALKAASRAFGR